jgi:hypothetical protein
LTTSFNLSPIKKTLPVNIDAIKKDLNDNMVFVSLVNRQVARNMMLAKKPSRNIGLMNTDPQSLKEKKQTGNKPRIITKTHLKLSEALLRIINNRNLSGNNSRSKNANREIKTIRKYRMNTVELIGEKKIGLFSAPQ